ncbi:MAG: NAD(P)/FAD-dependent oxidoreductase [Candidatus Omnitrophica bacterium]|nr:NAD(P)/FAD-dependent oxidoreductase [Candidatus Omnitrophota bacterium]
MKKFVIIGNSAAGISAAEEIRRRDKDAAITMISSEDYTAYCRCLISYYLAKDIKEEKIVLRPQSFYKDNNIELILDKEVTRVDPKKNRIICADKKQVEYDALLIASGASPKFPDIKGVKRKGVFGFRTIKDIREIESLLTVAKAACVLGGGLVGLKAAYALKKRGLEVKVIIKSQHVLSQVLDAAAAGLVEQQLTGNAIELIKGHDAIEIIGEGDVRAVKLDSGKALESGLIIVAKGVAANMNLVRESGIALNQGILVNDMLATNIPNIYAAGDVTESLDITLNKPNVNALWPVAVEQGRIAGANIAQAGLKYDGSLGMNSIEFFGLPVVSLGVYKTDANDPSYEVLQKSDPGQKVYKKFVIKDNVLIGAILAGKIHNSGIFLRLMREKINILSVKERFFADDFGYPEIRDIVREEEKIYL